MTAVIAGVLILLYAVVALFAFRSCQPRLAAEFPYTYRENPAEGTIPWAIFTALFWPVCWPLTVACCRRPR